MKGKSKGMFPEWDVCSCCPYVPAFCGKDVRTCSGPAGSRNGDAAGGSEKEVRARKNNNW